MIGLYSVSIHSFIHSRLFCFFFFLILLLFFFFFFLLLLFLLLLFLLFFLSLPGFSGISHHPSSLCVVLFRQVIRDPKIFNALRSVVASIDYGIRKSVNHPALTDEFGVGIKFLRVVQELMHINPKGLAER